MPKKILEKLRDLDLAIAAVTLGALILVTFSAVVARYFFNDPIYWGEEFQLICLVIVVFFGAGAGFRAGSHVAIDFFVELFPIKLQKIIAFIIFFLSIAMMLYFFVQSSIFVKQMFVTKRITDILQIPYYLIYAAFPIGCALIIINYSVVTFFKYFRPGSKEASQ